MTMSTKFGFQYNKMRVAEIVSWAALCVHFLMRQAKNMQTHTQHTNKKNEQKTKAIATTSTTTKFGINKMVIIKVQTNGRKRNHQHQERCHPQNKIQFCWHFCWGKPFLHVLLCDFFFRRSQLYDSIDESIACEFHGCGISFTHRQ